MPFFQNKNTQTAFFPPSISLGNDVIDSSTSNWNDFLNHISHTERRKAFQEFIFLLFYYQNRNINGKTFPHNELYDKVFKYFVDKDANDIPKNNAGNLLFTVSSGVSTKASGITDFLPKLRTNYSDIISDINIALVGLTSGASTKMGFFEESAIVFSYFYLTRQLIILNGYDWLFSEDLLAKSSTNFVPRIIKPDSIFASRKNKIRSKVDLAASSLPYFFNSLIDTLSTSGFIIPSQPYATATDITDIAYFVMLLDPYKPIGVVKSGVYMSGQPYNVNFSSSQTTVDIAPIPAWANLSSNPEYADYSFNTFIQDFYHIIGSNNRIPSGKLYYNSGLGTSMTVDQVKKQIRNTFDDLKKVIELSVLAESNGMMKIFLSYVESDADNSILASGVGNGSISLLGITNFGLPLLNYSMEDSTIVKDDFTSSGSKDITLLKKQVVHLGVYALDGPSGTNSDLSIFVDTIEKYDFKLQPVPTVPNRFINVISNPSTPTSTFYNTLDANGAKFFKRVSLPSGNLDVLVAEYSYSTKDLIFYSFTSAQLAVLSFPNTKRLNFKVKSAKTATNIYEELQSLISIFEEQTPQNRILNAKVQYSNDTFQLYSTPANSSHFTTTNKTSFANIFIEPSEQQTAKFILDLLKTDANNLSNVKTSFVTPVLFGSFVGKQAITFLPDAPTVVADTSYKPKYGSGVNVEHNHNGTNVEKNLYNLLRYSYADIKILPDVSITNGKKISIEIKSYVSPAPSFLSSKYTSDPIKLALFNSKKGAAANNQVLAMLRSFGLLEAIVQKFLFLMNVTYSSQYSVSEKAYITNKLKELFPDYLSTTATNFICRDENLTGATVLAGDIDRNNYEDLKIW